MAIIDVHVCTMPYDRPEWSSALKQDLDAEPVNQHWIEGAFGAVGKARIKGFSLGVCEFVSFADPDDRILPGTFEKLAQALTANPDAPFAWAGEQIINETDHTLRPPVVPARYDPEMHSKSAKHCHGVLLFRRALLMPELDHIASLNNLCEWVLTKRLARHGDPIPVPIVGRLWRRHERQSSIRTTNAERLAAVAAFDQG